MNDNTNEIWVSSKTPRAKVAAGALGGALAVIVAYVLHEAAGLDVPAEVAAAGTVLLSFVLGYFVKE